MAPIAASSASVNKDYTATASGGGTTDGSYTSPDQLSVRGSDTAALALDMGYMGAVAGGVFLLGG